MIKAVLFDFDHTLYDRRKSILASAAELHFLLSDYLHDCVTVDQFSDVFFKAETSPENHGVKGYIGVIDDIDKSGLFKVKPSREQYLEHFYPTLSKNISIFPDTYDVLRKLRSAGYKIGILTNGNVKIQNIKLSYTDLSNYTDSVVISGELGRQKPHPAPFIEICRRLGVRTDEAVYVGDQIFSDMCGARGAGLKTIWKPFTGSWPDDVPPPDFTIENLDEIPAIVKNLNK